MCDNTMSKFHDFAAELGPGHVKLGASGAKLSF